MEPLKKQDFVEIEYTGSIKGENTIFDTTNEEIAKEHNLHGEFSPLVICVGEQQILRGLDKSLEGKEVGEEYTIDLKAEEAFGNKDAKLIRIIPTSKFLQQKIHPMPGMQLNIDGLLGTVKTVSGGRTLVDFNHPLAGKELSYKIKINKKVIDSKEKLLGYLKLSLATKDIEAEVKEGEAKVTIKKEMPKEMEKEISNKIIKLISDIKSIDFIKNKIFPEKF